AAHGGKEAGIPLDDILYIKGLVGRLGPDQLHTLNDALPFTDSSQWYATLSPKCFREPLEVGAREPEPACALALRFCSCGPAL
ncbi:MAG TPA: hypothetical protein VMB21_20440, partial [Candidatus Limnocylindria bacterium]|nr:hypothetical protein [Candidatus Limnocylindria bacterium]